LVTISAFTRVFGDHQRVYARLGESQRGPVWRIAAGAGNIAP
jgi:hypothetical protein